MYNLQIKDIRLTMDLRAHPWVRDPVLALMRPRAAAYLNGERVDVRRLATQGQAMLEPLAAHWPAWVWLDCAKEVAAEYALGRKLGDMVASATSA
jgi:hypothetical protein